MVTGRAYGLLSLALLGCETESGPTPDSSEFERKPGQGDAPTLPEPGPGKDPAPGDSSANPAAQDPPRNAPEHEKAQAGIHFETGVDADLRSRSLPEQRTYLLSLLERDRKWTAARTEAARRLFDEAPKLGFGNPDVSQPAMTQSECRARWRDQRPKPADAACGHPNMVRAENASVCIDQFEFPNVLCEYPVVWVRASEAGQLCALDGKRLCDAHEWEGACAGEVLPPHGEYSYLTLPRGWGAEYRRNRRLLMEDWHNRPREVVWAYGAERNPSLCGLGSKKSPKCGETSFGACGTNDYPAGSFPDCVSPSGVYDQHGNVAEHMSLPLFPEELGGHGWTEMKGSWFMGGEPHADDCRWRARNWHTTRVTDPNSHNNYHLGFRCCADLPESTEAP